MAIQINGVAATIAQLGQVRADLNIPNRAGIGQSWSPYKYTGPHIVAVGNDLGNSQNTLFGTTPTDAVAVELWMNQFAADDYLFAAYHAGGLGSTGVLATNITNNLATRRYVTWGEKMVIPLTAVGGPTTQMRFAVGKTGAVINGRWIAASSNLRYKQSAASAAIELTGAAGNQTLPFNTATIFPNTGNQDAIELCIVGTPGAAARLRIDGVAATVGNGDPLIVGRRYFFDKADMGLSWSAMNLYLPTGVNVYGNTYDYA